MAILSISSILTTRDRKRFTRRGAPVAPLVASWLILSCNWTHAQYVDTTTSCLLCHRSAIPENDFCTVASSAIWAERDKHSRAFFLLYETDPADPQNRAAKRQLVRQILGFDLREAFDDDRYTRLKASQDPETAQKVATVKACLRCHATWPKGADETSPYVPPVPLALGVSCQGCHGPGEKWELPHRLAAWRLVTPEGKASLGCIDVRTTAEKAKLCASCHVGDLSQERFVKHEWYAAGHPPLPSFELATFEAEMPMHWQPLSQKGPFALRDDLTAADATELAGQIAALERSGVPPEAIKRSYREANFPDAAAGGLDSFRDLSRFKSAVLGGAAVLQAHGKLVGDYAALAMENRAPWPELALYDCAACHHELRSRLGLNRRPHRRHAPGRPPLAIWPAALATLAARQAAGDDEAQADSRSSQIGALLADLEQAATVRPFGDPAAIKAASQSLATALDRLAGDASLTPYDERAAARALRFLTDPANLETNDYATARQAAWAIRAITADLGADASALFSSEGDVLALALPSGPEQSVISHLQRWLPAASGYDATWFCQELDALRIRLGK